jgi:hypothetical protein
VCLFEDRPVSAALTYATLGLSRHVLDMPGGRGVRQELLLPVWRRFEDDDLARLLAWVAEQIVGEHHAQLRGDVIPLGLPIARGSRCSALYVSLPVVFPGELATCDETDPPSVFAWLVPIHPEEADCVKREGWGAFEDQLERADPDLFDLGRSPVV